METRIRIGVSACLLGQPVRYDGSHKYDQPYLKQQVFLNPHPLALKLRNHC
jgi:uncharacterized protein YbbK (DUF523 family)